VRKVDSLHCQKLGALIDSAAAAVVVAAAVSCYSLYLSDWFLEDFRWQRIQLGLDQIVQLAYSRSKVGFDCQSMQFFEYP
jgi:hypothetical protein